MWSKSPSFGAACLFAAGVRCDLAGPVLDTGQWRGGLVQDPASKRLDRGVAQAVFGNDELIVLGPPFWRGDWTNQASGRQIGFDEGKRAERDAQTVDGRLKLKVDVIEFEVPNRHEAGSACGCEPMRP